jgi:hypothetical protein
LRDGLPVERLLALVRKLLIQLVDDGLRSAWVHMASQFGLYTSRMHGRSSHATLAVSPVESHGEDDVSGLRSAVRNEGP